MPVLTWTQSIAAGATFEPLNGWQYEYIPFGGSIQILSDATATGIVSTITSGSDTLKERSPTSAGGTAGIMPSALDVPVIVDQVAAGDRQKILYENTTAGAISVNGFIDYRPGEA